MSGTITRAERRWHWRTWNLLLQIRDATDGEDARQRSGEMTARNLLVGYTPELRALMARGWVEDVDAGELVDDLGDRVRQFPAWQVTETGREALDNAVRSGLTNAKKCDQCLEPSTSFIGSEKSPIARLCDKHGRSLTRASAKRRGSILAAIQKQRASLRAKKGEST